MKNFKSHLLNWYKTNKRELPWRGESNPYFIWLSETILQQTRVTQGINYYYRFKEEFPTVNKLAQADEDKVLKVWQGLGYYSRARNLRKAALQVVKMGHFPTNYDSLIKLKGVGEYTAAAISSIAFNENRAVVDGNVYRVLARYFGIDTPIDSSEGKKEFKKLATELLDTKQPGTWNQAMMEFGAIHCTPKKPNCENCEISNSCFALKNNQVDTLPVKKGKTKVKTIYSYYFAIMFNEETYFIQRPKDGIWGGLFEFPNYQYDKSEETTSVLERFSSEYEGNKSFVFENLIETKHILSHRKIFASLILVKTKTRIKNNKWKKVNKNELLNLPVSRLTEKFLSKLKWD